MIFLIVISKKNKSFIVFLELKADNGTLYFWDWLTGYNFQRYQTLVQPGSIESENGIFAMTFDQSGSRLITCEADKTIKIYKEDEEAVNIF
jgi:pleiotropic regulator 1